MTDADPAAAAGDHTASTLAVAFARGDASALAHAQALDARRVWEAFEPIGLLAVSVADVAHMLTVMAGPDPRDRHSLPADASAFNFAPPETLRHARTVFSRTPGFAAVDREVVDIAAQVARRRLALTTPHCLAGPLERLLARQWMADEFTAAVLARKHIVNGMARFTGHCEFLLTPATAAATACAACEGVLSWAQRLPSMPAAVGVASGFDSSRRLA